MNAVSVSCCRSYGPGALKRLPPRLLAAVLAGVAAWAAGSNATPASARVPRRGTLTEGVAGYKYLSYVPTVRTNAAQKLPCILFLHGACPNEDLTKFRHFGPLKYGLAHEDFRFIVVCPATARGWTLPALAQLLDHAQAVFPVDPDRVYVTGYSMGGHGTWLLATAYPRRFAALAPVAGAGNPQEAAHKLRHLPIWIFHGVRDEVVPFSYGQSMAQALQTAGGTVKTTFYPDRGHDIWDKPYQGSELYDWFLQHRRGGALTNRASTTIASETNQPAPSRR
jgi:predicted peptidase